MFGHPLFSAKTPILCTLYFRTCSQQGIFGVRKFSDTKKCPLFLVKLLFFTTGIFCIFTLFTCVSGYSVIDKPLCPVCVVGNIMNSTARKPIVGKFELRMFRPPPHVHRLSRQSSLSVNYAYLVNISVRLHICVG